MLILNTDTELKQLQNVKIFQTQWKHSNPSNTKRFFLVYINDKTAR